MNRNQRVELLAPAGNPESFYGAIRAGADAVYLAGNKFGARAYAENFTTEELVRCIRYAHLLGRKVYLTVNTLLKEHEVAELYEYLRPFCEEGLDAVIVQDLGVLRFVREQFPDCKIHASTQMTLCGSEGASLLKTMGISRIVPARELSLKELIAIKGHVDLELETFIHGAMCYCYSGQCLFSSILGGRSGNRGRCAQPCRLPYTVISDGVKSGECYPLSLKDMCTVEHIPKLIEAGIDSFKIEGRMKKPEYAAGTTALYRKYMDRYYELREQRGAEEAAGAYRVEKKDWKQLTSLYIRSGIQDGYYFKNNSREMVTLDSPAYRGNDEQLLANIQKEYLEAPLKLPVAMKAVFHTGQSAELTMRQETLQISVTGGTVEKAERKPVTEENIRKQLGKLGESSFYADKIEIDADKDCFYPLQQINALRRTAVEKLEEQILSGRGYGKKVYFQEKNTREFCCRPDFAVPRARVFSFRTFSQLEAAAEQFHAGFWERYPLRLYVDGDLLIQDWERTRVLCADLPAAGGIYVVLPYILRERDRDYLEQLYCRVMESSLFRGFLVRSMDGLGFVRAKGNSIPCRADVGLYLWNGEAVRELSKMLEGFCLPYELKTSEQRAIPDILPCEKIIYGRIPMMITANCLVKTMGQCQKHRAVVNRGDYEGQDSEKIRPGAVLKDRLGKDFPVLINCAHCMNIIYNSVPFSLCREMDKWQNRVDLRMDFTLESASEVRQLLASLARGDFFPQGDYTTGHEKRGVE